MIIHTNHNWWDGQYIGVRLERSPLRIVNMLINDWMFSKTKLHDSEVDLLKSCCPQVIVLFAISEAPDYKDLVELINLLDFNDQVHFMCVIAGQPAITHPTANVTMIPILGHFAYIGSAPLVTPTPLRNKFLCLANAPRPHRVLLIDKIFNSQFATNSIISLAHNENTFRDGSIGIDELKDEIRRFSAEYPISENLISQLPLKADGVVTQATAYHTNPMGCFFNVVNETSYEELAIPYTKFWTIPFITEKTVKCFLGAQVPIWNTVYGFVNWIRDSGFDVFDDIVDHSYTNEKDPIRRIDMVYAELSRLNSAYTLADLSHLHSTLTARFEHNHKNLGKFAARSDAAFRKQFMLELFRLESRFYGK